jgi:hypothetical protein
MVSWNVSSVAESLAVMMNKERTIYRKRDYLSESPSSTVQGFLDQEDRTKVVEWCYSVVDICQLERESVAIAMEMVDRFLSNKASTTVMDVLGDRIQFQLLTLTALYVSIKVNMKIALGSDFFSCISRELYPVKDIEAMELKLLKELSWCISAPTCVQVAHHIITLLSMHVTLDTIMEATILNEVDYQAECAVREYYFVTQRPSTVAMAAIFNTLDRFEKHKCQDIVHALLSIMETVEEFESIEVILATRIKLHGLVYGSNDTDRELDTEDEETDDHQWYLY